MNITALSVKKPPMDNVKVRQAFALAIDRDALAKFRKTIKPLINFTPEGIFPKYEEARKKVFAEELKKAGNLGRRMDKRACLTRKAPGNC